MANNRIDVMGKKFGKLLVIGETDKRNKAKAPLYECLCDCGNKVYRSATKLLVSEVPRCDKCIAPYNRGKSNKAKGETGRNSLLSSYKIHARKRNLEWNLTVQEFKDITESTCHYCGDAPSKISYGSSGLTRDHGAYTYNGIDRKNNSEGYNLENCVPCCTSCNIMKMDISYVDFIRKCKKISTNLSLLEEGSTETKGN